MRPWRRGDRPLTFGPGLPLAATTHRRRSLAVKGRGARLAASPSDEPARIAAQPDIVTVPRVRLPTRQERARREQVVVAAIPHQDGARIVVHGDAVYIDGLVVTDPDVVASVKEATDPVAAVHERLTLGARVLRLAQARIDGDVIRDEVERLTERFTGTVTDAVDSIAQTSTKLLDADDGLLTAALTEFRDEVEKLLGDAFDADSRSSILSRIEAVHTKVGEDQLRVFRRLLNPDAEESPLHSWRTEIVEQVRQHVGAVGAEVRGLAEKVLVQQAAQEATAIEQARGTAKGFTYEDQLHSMIESCAMMHGDLAMHVGRERGAKGNCKGDEVVSVNTDDTRGAAARIVFEIKDTKLSEPKTFQELDAAIENREASVGIAVFSSQSNAPSMLPFVWYGNKAIIVINKAEPDAATLRLAYTWARWAVRRSLQENPNSIDIDRIESLLDDARRELLRRTNLRRSLSTATNKIAEARRDIDSMTEGVEAVIDSICTAISR